MNPNTIEDALGQLLQSSHDLKSLLQAERAALETCSNEALELLIEQKAAALATLEQAKIQFETLLTHHQSNAQQAALLNGKIKSQLQALSENSQVIQNENLINGDLIHRGQIQLQKLLAIFRGHDPEHQLYDQRGLSTPADLQTPLKSA